MANNKNSRKRRKKKKSRKLLLFVFEVLLLAVLLLVAYFVSMMNRIKYENLDESEAGINSDLDENTILSLEGYTNIALFGLDNRSSNNYDRGNSDVIMIASINNKTNEVKLVSVFRDTLLKVGDEKYGKANSAYNIGGPTDAIALLNRNFDMDIESEKKNNNRFEKTYGKYGLYFIDYKHCYRTGIHKIRFKWRAGREPGYIFKSNGECCCI